MWLKSARLTGIFDGPGLLVGEPSIADSTVPLDEDQSVTAVWPRRQNRSGLYSDSERNSLGRQENVATPVRREFSDYRFGGLRSFAYCLRRRPNPRGRPRTADAAS